MAGFNLLNIGSQALLANRTALSVVSQNIANASTEGYSRQTANFVSVLDRGGSIIQDIGRATDKFITQQLWSDISSFNSLNLKDTLTSQTDDLLASSGTSISTALDTYFTSMQNAVDDPTSLANRELYIEESAALARRFNNLSANLVVQNNAANAAMEASAENLTQYSKSVAELNDQITYLIGRDEPVNELRDQRDVLVNKISEIVDVNVVEQGNNYNLFIGNGQPLVVGQTVNVVELRQGNPDSTQSQIYIKMSGSEINITQQVSGGVLGGIKDFRNDILNPSLNELGRIAIALAEETNTQHRKGMDLNNDLGGDVFLDINAETSMQSRIKANNNNLSTVNVARVQITDTTKLTLDDYQLIVKDNNELLVKRQPSGTVVSLTKAAVDATPLPANTYFLDSGTGDIHLQVDGVSITVDTVGFMSIGDSYTVQPTRDAAAQISSIIDDAKKVALASPVRITTNPNNTGSAVASVEVTDPTDTSFMNIGTTGQLNPPVEIVFNNAVPTEYSIYDISNPLDPQLMTLQAVLQQDIVFVPGTEFDLGGYKFTIDQIPKAGDRFSFDFNQDGVSDNQNALALSAIQSKALLINGSLQDHYSGIVEKVGAKAATGKINLTASESVLRSTKDSLASIIGVNLDEEAARLVQFQQAYQASARVISTSQLLFNTLLESF
ncbi:MAG: flagellar hook-associated protein FlgK [Pseudomonadales bacterium]|nr:flagellar hook-associated protein FlgK [Pseudomonadales bacterium]NRA17345.1 flagellar hook-associated protein FlgK [Oceanospirillaceae bacterium]